MSITKKIRIKKIPNNHPNYFFGIAWEKIVKLELIYLDI